MKNNLELQHQYFRSGATMPLAFRIKMLKTLRTAINEYEEPIKQALKEDLNKSSFEAYTTEIGFCLHSIRQTIKHLPKWMKSKKIKTPFFQGWTRSYMSYEPLGTVLIIGPYNYPFHLVIEPLIGAIAAGNTVFVKPSEFPSATESIIKTMLEHHFSKDYITVITGDATTTQQLLALKFDHIFFTGSTRVGKIIYQAAANHLTPVTLELGGKSPVIVDETAELNATANRIVFGKFINAGQTCIAPDYVYVHASIKDALVTKLVETVDKFYPDFEEGYGKIINQNHFERLYGLIDENKVVNHIHTDATKQHISPIILDQITWDDPVMKEEIFGPILPILIYDNIDELIKLLKTKDKPLALYLFSKSKQVHEKVFNQLSFGGGAINDTITHVANWHLPFGGVGASGIGRYHGHASFSTFSNLKSWVKKSVLFDPKLPYPPYKNKEKWVKRLLK